MRSYLAKTIEGNQKMDSSIEYVDDGNRVLLIYKYGNTNIRSEDDSPFFALVKIREELEKMHLMILCNGSRVDVYPSGASSAGILAYELKLSKPATKLINIFDSIRDSDKLGSVVEQKEFRDKWLNSLK